MAFPVKLISSQKLQRQITTVPKVMPGVGGLFYGVFRVFSLENFKIKGPRHLFFSAGEGKFFKSSPFLF